MNKTVLFDFDGTIADTFVLVQSIFKKLSTEIGYKEPTDEEIELLRTKSPQEAMKAIGFSPLKLPLLIYRVKKEMHKHMLDVKPIKGIEKALVELKKHQYSLGIVTSNNQKNVYAFLEKNNMDLFDFIQTENNIFGKARVLSKVLNEHAIKKIDAIYVGDEIRDIQAAKKVAIKIISVTWGFNEKNALQTFHPDALLDTPQALPSLIKSL